MVAEGVVLRGIEHLEQGRGRITPVVGSDLVDLVEQQNRVHRTGLADRADDASRQRTHVGATVPADLRLVPDATQRDPDELAPEGAGDALAQ